MSSFNTANVTDMYSMFSWCSSLTSLDVSNFNTALVTDMYGMFNNCSSLTSLDLSGFDTKNVTDMSFMFYIDSSLTSLDLSCFNTENVTSMGRMFYKCGSLTSLNLSSFNTANVTDMDWMLSWCGSLTTIYVSDKWSTGAVVDANNMFTNSTSLMGGIGTTYDVNHVDKEYARIDDAPESPGYFTDPNNIIDPDAPYAALVENGTTLQFRNDGQRLTMPNIKTYSLNAGSDTPRWGSDNSNANVTTVVFDASFADARPTSTYSWFSQMSNLTTITDIGYLNTSEVTNMGSMFNGCTSLRSINLSSFNTTNVTNMSYMFSNCKSLTSIDVASFNTASVTNMSYMFYSCNSLNTIYAGVGWSTATVTNSTSMFNNCSNLVGGMGTTFTFNHVDKEYARIDGGESNPGYLTDIRAYAVYDATNTSLTFYYDKLMDTRTGTKYIVGGSLLEWINTSTLQPKVTITTVVFDPSFINAHITNTSCWFIGMNKLQSIVGLNNLNTSEVTNMQSMFEQCSRLDSLDLSSFDTHNVSKMSYMFSYCSALTSLDLSSFNTNNVTNMAYMFRYCNALKKIYVINEWTTSSVTQSTSMFYGCTSLVGGRGTTYDANHVDREYARIDDGATAPGYFTDKTATLLGDVNLDDKVDVTDVNIMVNIILGKDQAAYYDGRADVNSDNTVDVSDVNVLVNIILGKE